MQNCDLLLYIGVKILFRKLAAMSGVLITFLHVNILYFVTAGVSSNLPIHSCLKFHSSC